MRARMLMASLLLVGVGGGCEAKGPDSVPVETVVVPATVEPEQAVAKAAAEAPVKPAPAAATGEPARPITAAAADKAPTAQGASVADTKGALTTLKLGVTGMSCVSCEMKIRAAVEKLPGVSDCVASVATTSATVSFDAAQVSRAQIEKAIQGAGYDIASEAPKLAN